MSSGSSSTITPVPSWMPQPGSEGDREWLSQPPQVDPTIVLTEAEKLETVMGEQFEILFENFININA